MTHPIFQSLEPEMTEGRRWRAFAASFVIASFLLGDVVALGRVTRKLARGQCRLSPETGTVRSV